MGLVVLLLLLFFCFAFVLMDRSVSVLINCSLFQTDDYCGLSMARPTDRTDELICDHCI